MTDLGRIIGNNMDICTTVAAMGEAEADYTYATFSLSLSTTEKTVPLAKNKMKEKVAQLHKYLNFAIEKHGIVISPECSRTDISASPKYIWVKNIREQVLEGYEVKYNFYFRTETLNKVSELYDELISLPEITVSSPSFGLKDVSSLNELALQDAWQNAQKRFSNECRILGLSIDDYVISSWLVEYSDSHRIDRGLTRMSLAAPACVAVAGAAYQDEPMEIMAGTAKVSVNLNVSYKKRS